MKRNRLWWIAGALVLSVVVVAVGLWCWPSSGAPRVSLAFLGYTNVPSGGGEAKVRGAQTELAALIRIDNRGGADAILCTLIAHASGASELDKNMLALKSVAESSRGGFNMVKRGTSMVVTLKLGGQVFPWNAEFGYRPVDRWTLFLARHWPKVPYFVQTWTAQNTSLFGRLVVQLGPITNVPPRELFANTAWGRLEALNSPSMSMTQWVTMMRTNLLLLGTNKPPAEVNPGGGLKRLEF